MHGKKIFMWLENNYVDEIKYGPQSSNQNVTLRMMRKALEFKATCVL